MFYALLKVVHVLAVLLWVGGMVFVMGFLRPALPVLEPPQRLRLMAEVLQRFFAAVTIAVAAVLATGAALLDHVARRVADTGGRFTWPTAWVLMTAVGLLMAVIYVVIRWRLYPPLARAVAAGRWPEAAAALGRIRTAVGVNLGLGLATVAVAVAGWPA